MASLNKVMLIGNLGKDPEVKYTPSGLQIAKFSLATTDRVKKGDDWENVTEWHSVTCFGKSAEFAGKYWTKGCTAYIEGRIKTESWDDNGVKKYKTGIIADKVMSLTKREAEQTEETQQEPQSDDLPF